MLTAVPAVALTAALTVGCGDSGTLRDAQARPDRPASPTTSAQDTSRNPADDQTENNEMRIGITIGDQRFTASLRASAASRDLIEQLPLTVDMVDHGGVEKTGPLPAPLSLEGQPEGADPDVGDVGYYAPGNDLVLYYENQSFFPGIVVLGRMDGDAAVRIADLDGPVTATVEER